MESVDEPSGPERLGAGRGALSRGGLTVWRVALIGHAGLALSTLIGIVVLSQDALATGSRDLGSVGLVLAILIALVLLAVLVPLTVRGARLAWGQRGPVRREGAGRVNLLFAGGVEFGGAAVFGVLRLGVAPGVLMILAAVIAVVGAIALMPLEEAEPAM